jgi:hypothetical protein
MGGGHASLGDHGHLADGEGQEHDDRQEERDLDGRLAA